MSLRLKLFLPTLIGLLLFAAFINFYWTPNREQKQFDHFYLNQAEFLKTIEPEISRALVTSDLATLIEILDQQMTIHNKAWKYLSLTLANETQVYPLDDIQVPEGKHIFELSFNISEAEDSLAIIELFIDWEPGHNIIHQHTVSIELVLFLTFAIIVILGTLWQNRMIISPLINLKEAVNRFQQGDYEHELVANSEDEIGELIRHFDMMRKEHQQNEESQRIASVAFEILEGIIITDNQGNIIRVNNAFTEITGYSEPEVIGKNPRILHSAKHDKKFYKHMWADINSNGRWLGEIWNKRKNGEIFPLFATITAVKNDHDKITHFVASYLDISESKRQQKELEVARDKAEIASRAKSDFLATMSHEIRTPMNGVLGMAQLLEDTGLTKQQRDYLNTIKLSGQNLLTIINDILDFSKIEAQKMELELVPFNLKNTSFEVARLLTSKATEKGLELLFNISSDCPQYVTGDPGRIRQVLLNLLGNSIKFTQTGHVLLEIRCIKKKDDNATFCFRVEDTGIGISEEQQPLLFKPFTQADSSTTRKFGGTGLGLSICHQIIKLMDGQIKIQSEPGKGSAFSFKINLPLAEAPEALRMHSLEGTHLLLVDDNQTNLTILEEQFKSEGIKTVATQSPTNVLEILRASLKSEPFDAIILDFCMPQLDGAELGKKILADAALKHIPLILLTSAGQRGDLKRFEEIGFAGYLSKPVMDKTILSMVAAVTDEKYSRYNGKILTSHSITDASAGDEADSLTTPQITNTHVLLAEDDPVNQQVALGILKKLCLTPDLAANGIEAVDLASKNYYDLILMDCQMPEKDGFIATREIRQLQAHHQTPIIALTANVQSSDRDRCLESGMDDFLSKPFEFDELIKILNRWLPESAFSEDVATEIRAVSQPPENSPKLLNTAVYQKLRATIPDSFDKIIETFIRETADKIRDIRRFIDEENFEDSTRLSHSLKSSSATLGAMALSHSAALLETSCRQADQQASQTLCTDLSETFSTTRVEILKQ